MENETYKVFESNLAGFQRQLDKLNKRADKLGVPRIATEIVGHEDRPVIGEDGYPTGQVRRILLMTCTGSTPKIAGWSLIGVIEPVMDGNEQVIGNQTRAIPGQSVPAEYRNVTMLCAHCHTIRNRREVFIVRNADSQHKQVGRQCLVDFLGGADPQALIAAATLLRAFLSALDEAEDDEREGGGHREVRYELLEFLARTSKIIRDSGWMPRSKQTDEHPATVLAVEASYWPKSKEWFTPPVEGDENYQRATDAIAWLEALSVSEQSDDYLYNLSLLAGAGSIRPKQTGLAASAIAALMRAKNREIEQAKRAAVEAVSEYFGEVKKREVFTLTLQFTRLIPSDYGETILHKFVDASGNIATWFSSRGEICAIGETVTVKATVKGHEEYRGVKQTMLTRVTICVRKTDSTAPFGVSDVWQQACS